MSSQLNTKIADFSFHTTSGNTMNLSQLSGKNVVLYFYPKDNTPGCTTESKDFRDNMDDFAKANTVIFGISRDSLQSHEKFKTKYCLPFELIVDEAGELCTYFGVLKEKSLFGLKFNGIERSTFLIDKDGVLNQEWRKVKVAGHAKEVLAAVQNLNTK